MKMNGIEAYWETIVDTIQDGVMVVTPEGTILYVNRAFEVITGYRRDEMEGQPCALRYESTPADSADGVAHGRVFLQMFPFFPANETQATEAAGKIITWMMTGRDE